jgi:hypothetical protein
VNPVKVVPPATKPPEPAAKPPPADQNPAATKVEPASEKKPEPEKADSAASKTPAVTSPPASILAPTSSDWDRAIPAAEAQEDSSSFVFKVAVVQFVSVLAALFLGPLVLLVALCYVLRRYAANPGSLFRVEVVNTLTGPATGGGHQSAGTGLASDAERPFDPQALLAPPAEPEPQEDSIPNTAQPFDLGMTYEEERRLQQEALLHQEEALLRTIFEQNVQLREQFEDLTPDNKGSEEGVGAEEAEREGASEQTAEDGTEPMLESYIYDDHAQAADPHDAGDEDSGTEHKLDPQGT